MNNNQLININQNSKQALIKSKKLLDLTNKIITYNHKWIYQLLEWADKNDIPDYIWIEDKDTDKGGYYTGIPRNKQTLLSLKYLRLNDLNIVKLPDEIFNLIQLEELKIINCNLESISPQIQKLINLRNLSLNKNQLSKLPGELSNLHNLCEIHLALNVFIDFPKVLYKMKSLKHICIYSNQITSICNDISNLSGLEELMIHENNLINLPLKLFNLKNLIKLTLCNTEINRLSNRIGLLINLETLLINDTKIKKLPKEIKNLKKLKLLILENNELMNNLPNEIIEINISYGLLLRNMPKLVLTSSQKQWIKNLKNNGTFIAYNDNLLDVI